MSNDEYLDEANGPCQDVKIIHNVQYSEISVFSNRMGANPANKSSNNCAVSAMTFDGVAHSNFFDPTDSKYNRKEKSLGELCRRFLGIYGKEQKDLLLLDQCTRELGVERRRIYDIINILESFCVIRRQAKNSYQWRGIDRIVHSIEA